MDCDTEVLANLITESADANVRLLDYTFNVYWKVHRLHFSIGSCVCLSGCLFVFPLQLQIKCSIWSMLSLGCDTVTLSPSQRCSNFTDITCPGIGLGKNIGLWDFVRSWLCFRSRNSVLQEHLAWYRILGHINCSAHSKFYKKLRTRQIIRYRATATIRRLEITQNTISNERGLQNQREHHII